MARRGRRGRRGGKGRKAIPLAIVIPAVLPALQTWGAVTSHDPKAMAKDVFWRYTGLQEGQAWNSRQAFGVLGMIIGGVIAHKVANKVGVNSKLKRATMGWIQI